MCPLYPEHHPPALASVLSPAALALGTSLLQMANLIFCLAAQQDKV